MSTTSQKNQRRQCGFTLIELGVVLAIIGVLASIAVPSVSYFLRQGRVKNVTGSINSIRNWVGSLQASGLVGGALPVTEGSRPPSTGAALSAQDAVEVANAARLDHILVSAGITDKLLTFGMGAKLSASEGSGAELSWHPSKRTFFMSAGSGVISDTDTAKRDWSNCSRLETRLSNPAVAPSEALGANFRLDGVTNMPANTIVTYAVLKEVPYKDAIELAKAMNGEDLVPSAEDLESAQDLGPVVFQRPGTGSATVDVYVFVASL